MNVNLMKQSHVLNYGMQKFPELTQMKDHATLICDLDGTLLEMRQAV